MDVLAREVVGVLAHVEGADKHRAGSFEAAHERAVASAGGRSRLILEPARVARPATSMRFLTANGTPASGPAFGRPRCRVDRVGARERALPGNVGERVRAAVDRGDACKRRLGDLPRACAPG